MQKFAFLKTWPYPKDNKERGYVLRNAKFCIQREIKNFIRNDFPNLLFLCTATYRHNFFRGHTGKKIQSSFPPRERKSKDQAGGGRNQWSCNYVHPWRNVIGAFVAARQRFHFTSAMLSFRPGAICVVLRRRRYSQYSSMPTR